MRAAARLRAPPLDTALLPDSGRRTAEPLRDAATSRDAACAPPRCDGGGWQYASREEDAIAPEDDTHLPFWHVARRLADRERGGEAAVRRCGDAVAARTRRRVGEVAAAEAGRPPPAARRRGGEAAWYWLPSRGGEEPPSRCSEVEARPPPRGDDALALALYECTAELGTAEAGR